MRRLALSFLFLAACGSSAPKPHWPLSPCRQQAFEGSRFTVCDPGRGELRLIAAARREKPLRSFAAVAAKIPADRVAFAMNAGMFDEEGRPIGLTELNGTQIRKINLKNGSGNFHLKPNGVFTVRVGGSAAIFPSDRPLEFRAPPLLTVQSGPMLVIDGQLHPKFAPDGSSRVIRNGVGVKDGKSLFVISEDPVSLGKFARYFRDALKTPNALYFDGSVSSLWDPANARQDSHSELGPIIVALKPEESAPGRAGPATP